MAEIEGYQECPKINLLEEQSPILASLAASVETVANIPRTRPSDFVLLKRLLQKTSDENSFLIPASDYTKGQSRMWYGHFIRVNFVGDSVVLIPNFSEEIILRAPEESAPIIEKLFLECQDTNWKNLGFN